MCKLRDEHAKKDEGTEILNSKLESMEQLLYEAAEVIRKLEEKLNVLQTFERKNMIWLILFNGGC